MNQTRSLSVGGELLQLFSRHIQEIMFTVSSDVFINLLIKFYYQLLAISCFSY